MSTYLVRLVTEDSSREHSIARLGRRIADFGADIEIIESGRRAYTVACSDAVATALEDAVAGLAAVDTYQGLRPLSH